jgi:erythromycin esterase-like protein
VRRAARPLRRASRDYDALIDLIGGARFVLLGEASHGTHEFYAERARITQRLIEEKGFKAIAVEADWPDAYRVNQYVRGASRDATAEAALGDFQRFPRWMWRNSDARNFIAWLHEHNQRLSSGTPKVAFYGMDLYSLFTSMEAVVSYLAKVDPEAARQARERYSCFDHFGADPQVYGYAARSDLHVSCEDEVVRQLVELKGRAADYAKRDGRVAEDEYFYAEQNARLAKNAERYYRAMFQGRVSSWNLRDRHMAETLEELVAHLDRQGGYTKVVVWAHNSHLGDARATELGAGGELNVGQLVRERYGRDAVLVGFTTYDGTVTAADNWDDPPRMMRVVPGLANSFEALFHETGLANFLLTLRDSAEVSRALRVPRLERAIGVIYRPRTERLSHYFHARLSDQFDAVIHIDHTQAVEPLDLGAGLDTEEVPETFPSGV